MVPFLSFEVPLNRMGECARQMQEIWMIVRGWKADLNLDQYTYTLSTQHPGSIRVVGETRSVENRV